MRAGYVLVGGQSSRMGRDKACLPLDAEPLGARVARMVAEAAGSVALVGHPERHSGLGYPVVPDRYPGEGPLGGILTALHHTTADRNLIVACDMPGLTVEFLKDLLQAAERNPLSILIPETEGGRLEPLCAVYHRDTLAALERAFADGIRKVTAAFRGVGVAAYPVAEVARFQNLNTPEDWARYAAG
jgi:molybdopterin-guanine dinucleotide biosynthesis protein A